MASETTHSCPILFRDQFARGRKWRFLDESGTGGDVRIGYRQPVGHLRAGRVALGYSGREAIAASSIGSGTVRSGSSGDSLGGLFDFGRRFCRRADQLFEQSRLGRVGLCEQHSASEPGAFAGGKSIDRRGEGRPVDGPGLFLRREQGAAFDRGQWPSLFPLLPAWAARSPIDST